MAKRRQSKNPEIEKLFDSLCYAKTPWEVWMDIIQMFAITMANSLDVGERRDKREKTYLQIAKKYSEQETKVIVDILSQITMAYETNPDQDLLGDLYMALNLGSSELGQFFTPYCVCKSMAKMTIDKGLMQNIINEKGYFTVNEPACGAGATIIALVNKIKAIDINYQTDFYIVAQDVSYIAVLMCYIQLSLLGCAAVVIVGNTLTSPPTTQMQTNIELADNMWLTPMYHSKLWQMRREARLVSEMLHYVGKEMFQNKPTEKKKPTPQPKEEIVKAVQLSLF